MILESIKNIPPFLIGLCTSKFDIETYDTTLSRCNFSPLTLFRLETYTFNLLTIIKRKKKKKKNTNKTELTFAKIKSEWNFSNATRSNSNLTKKSVLTIEI